MKSLLHSYKHNLKIQEFLMKVKQDTPKSQQQRHVNNLQASNFKKLIKV